MINKEENVKKSWETPEIYDLDVDKTAGGLYAWTEEDIGGAGSLS
jgi:hypothetical protein